MSDEEILKLSYRKPSRFGELFDRHQKRFLRIAKRTLRSGDDAEDVVQEAFVRIYKYGQKFPENGGKFTPWANTILKNCMADQINKYKNMTVSLTEEIENTSPDLIDLNQQAVFENKSYVQSVLNKIGGTAAEIMNLRYVLGKSFKEIAKILNIKNSTARVRVYRSKKIFIQEYKQFNNQTVNYE
jgi:RNA polymerase sigma factor (sigma-70 family)